MEARQRAANDEEERRKRAEAEKAQSSLLSFFGAADTRVQGSAARDKCVTATRVGRASIPRQQLATPPRQQLATPPPPLHGACLMVPAPVCVSGPPPK